MKDLMSHGTIHVVHMCPFKHWVKAPVLKNHQQMYKVLLSCSTVVLYCIMDHEELCFSAKISPVSNFLHIAELVR